MSLFEWFGERHNPGPVGDVDVGSPPEREPTGVGVRAIAALIALGAWIFALTRWTSSGDGLTAAIVATSVYLGLSYFVHPKPDYSNMGIAGFIDHPFKWSDDANRMLAFLLVLLWPGRFVTTAIVDALRTRRGSG